MSCSEIAALARPTVNLVAAAHGDRERVISALEAGADEGVVELDDSSIRFAHPLLASICYEQAPVWKRQAVHRRLADVVTDAEERARHLALAADGPDARIASELETAAEQAAARGAPGAAAELSELAGELTADGSRPRTKAALPGGHPHRAAGDVEQAVSGLASCSSKVPPVSSARTSSLRVSRGRWGDIPGSRSNASRRGARAAAGDDDLRSARILALLRWSAPAGGDGVAALSDARAAVERAERARDPTVLALAIAYAGHTENTCGASHPRACSSAESKMEEELGTGAGVRNTARATCLPPTPVRHGETDRPRAQLELLETKAASRGDEITRVMVLWSLSALEWLAGRWDQALEHATAAHELTEQTSTRTPTTGSDGRRRSSRPTSVSSTSARASVDEVLAHSQTVAYEIFIIATLGVLGRLELELGNLEAAGRTTSASSPDVSSRAE